MVRISFDVNPKFYSKSTWRDKWEAKKELEEEVVQAAKRAIASSASVGLRDISYSISIT